MILSDFETFMLSSITHDQGMESFILGKALKGGLISLIRPMKILGKSYLCIITQSAEVSGRFPVSYFYVTDIRKLMVVR